MFTMPALFSLLLPIAGVFLKEYINVESRSAVQSDRVEMK
jgi:hypothetical protein